MRYIDKSIRCQEYDDFMEKFGHRAKSGGFDKIKKMGSVNGPQILKTLFTHLFSEQKGLCIYCEQAILSPQDLKRTPNAHIEHLKPKSLPQFKVFQFEYENLGVSCDGFDPATQFERTRQFCGHRKSNKFDGGRFLNPIEVEDIQTYFSFDIEGHIFPSPNRSKSEQEKAQYMIDLLELNYPELNSMRKTQYEIIIQEESQGLDIAEYLGSEHHLFPGFYSMLVQLFM